MPAKKKSPATANRKKPKFRRVLLKISGEVLGGETGGICPESVHDVAAQVREVAKLGVQIGVVVGGGNIFRGLQGSEKGIERVTGDQMGMLATVINSMALQDALEKQGVPTRVQSAITMSQVAEPFIRRRAVRHLEKGRVVIFGGGTGNPYCSTDTAAALRANEIAAEVNEQVATPHPDPQEPKDNAAAQAVPGCLHDMPQPPRLQNRGTDKHNLYDRDRQANPV